MIRSSKETPGTVVINGSLVIAGKATRRSCPMCKKQTVVLRAGGYWCGWCKRWTEHTQQGVVVTDAQRAKIVELIEAGVQQKDVARTVGLKYTTLMSWLAVNNLQGLRPVDGKMSKARREKIAFGLNEGWSLPDVASFAGITVARLERYLERSKKLETNPRR